MTQIIKYYAYSIKRLKNKPENISREQETEIVTEKFEKQSNRILEITEMRSLKLRI